MNLKTLRDIQDDAIEERLSYFDYDTYLTAKSLGIARKTVYNRAHARGITPSEIEASRKSADSVYLNKKERLELLKLIEEEDGEDDEYASEKSNEELKREG